mgnify:CR=1 FL=1|jgi:ABC-type polysaccharide/polyol phosphate export permease
MGSAVWHSRGLVWELFKRDFLAAYRKSFIGITWLFVMPAMGIVSWVFLQRTGILQPGETEVPYTVYVLVGTTMFGLFITLYDAAANTLESGKDLALQVRYPHEALLFKQAAEQLANFSIGLLMNLLVLALFRVMPSWKIVLLPLVALPLIMMATALGLVASMISVVAVDISRFLRLGLGLALWATPVIYSSNVESPVVRTLIRWNPLSYAVCSCRDIVLKGELYHPIGFWITCGFSTLMLLLSWRLFYVSEDKVIERLI